MKTLHSLVALTLMVAMLGVWGGVSHAATRQQQKSHASAVSKTPFKTLRGVIFSDGSVAAGSGGFTVSHPSTGTYTVSFPAGTFNKTTSTGTQACLFVPMVSGYDDTAQMVSILESTDGSGSFSVQTNGTNSNGNFTFIASSASC